MRQSLLLLVACSLVRDGINRAHRSGQMGIVNYHKGKVMSILLKGISIEHSYREGKIVTPVLKGVNLTIQSSKMTAIVGKSGSGKSTLLHMLGTLDTPEHGQILFNDIDVTKLTDRQKAHFRNRHLGFIYQFHHLLDDFTVLENVMLPLMIARAEKDLTKSRALYLLERVGLSDRLKYLPSELSGGERQRVAIARALVHSPDLILADEPTGNLDEENASTVFELFRELVRDEKTAVVMVTHDLSLANQCDEIFEMVGGIVHPKKLQRDPELENEDLDDDFYEESNSSSPDILDRTSARRRMQEAARSSRSLQSKELSSSQQSTATKQDASDKFKACADSSKAEQSDAKSQVSEHANIEYRQSFTEHDEVNTIDEDDGTVILLQQSDSNHALEQDAKDRRSR